MVAVVGTGSTAAQIVPAIQPIVKKLYVFQREPGWVMPKGERDLSDAERQHIRRSRGDGLWTGPGCAGLHREEPLGRGDVPARHQAQRHRGEQGCSDYIAREFADRPDLREAVTPTYPYPGKRPILASTFYPALKKENVELVPRAVSRVTKTGIVDAEGVERPVDVIAMATGSRRPTTWAACRSPGDGA